jgi:hypothetical protein
MIRLSEAFPAIIREQTEFLSKISIIKRLVWTWNTWSPAIIAWKDVFGGVLPLLALDFIGTGTREPTRKCSSIRMVWIKGR